MSFRWWSSDRSDCGRRRKINEDAFVSLPEQGVWVVADGMGGHSRGDRASQIVVEAFQHWDTGSDNFEELVSLACDRLREANLTVLEETATLPDGKMMGSTAAVLVIHRSEFACLWVGDSRVYRLRHGQFQLLTKDHSVVQQMVDSGEIQASQARGHPASNRITRAVGAKQELAIDQVRGTLQDGDTLLLCSDGLVVEVEDEEIASLLEGPETGAVAQELLDLALERGARDNVTLQVVQIEETTGTQWNSENDTAINYDLRKRLSNGVRTAIRS